MNKIEFSPQIPNKSTFNGIMILGEAPGAEEEKTGMPFVGMSGQLLRKTLQEVGIDPNDCYISNVFWERPPNNKIDHFFTNKTDPERSEKYIPYKSSYVKKQYENSFIRLESELKDIKPRIVIGVGAIPLWTLTGNLGITRWRGQILPINGPTKYVKCNMLVAYHPAYILRNRTLISVWREDLLKAVL